MSFRNHEHYRYEVRVVEMNISTFRTLFSTCTEGGKGYLFDNPYHIVRLKYYNQTLCYVVSESLVQATESDLVKIGVESWWLGGEVKIESRATCIRQSGSMQVIRSSICAGPSVLPEDRIEGILQMEPPMGSYHDRLYFVPPCIATLLMVPMLGRTYSRPDTKIRIRPRKSERIPDQLDEFLTDIVGFATILDDEGKDRLTEVLAAGRELRDAKEAVEVARAKVLSAVRSYGDYSRNSKQRMPFISTTPKVYGLEVSVYGDRKYYKIGNT